MSRTGLFVVAGLLAVGLGGCESLSGVFTEKKSSPDEFAVFSEPPLSMPPDYGLRPPRPGAARPQKSTPRFQAKRAMLGAGRNNPISRPPPRGSSQGVQVLLRETGALQANPDIRTLVNRESSLVATSDKKLTDRLLFWRGGAKDDPVVDPAKEAKRIREAIERGQPVTGEKSPTILRK